MPKPRVTESERRQASTQDRERSPLERIGATVAARIGFRAQQAALRAWRKGNDVAAASRQQIEKALPVLIDAMLAADLTGRKRSGLTAGVGLALRAPKSGYEGTLKFLARRLALTPSALAVLRARHEAGALKVLRTAEDHIERELQKTIQQVATEGMHVREGSKVLGEAFDRLGLTPTSSHMLEAIFRTQTALAYGAGRYVADQDPAIQEILWGYKYLTVGDDRVRPSHVGFDGVTLPKTDPFWHTSFPPNGYNCRCTAISIFEERTAVSPETVDVDGVMVKPTPDDGFSYNPGLVFGVAV